MAQKGLFFNAFPNDEYETGYDRNYSADDISNWLQVVLTTGVIKTDSVAGTGNPLGLKINASSGLTVQVNPGLAVIKGKPFINDSLAPITLPTAPTGSSPRYDCISVRYNNAQVLDGRKITLSRRSLDHIPTASDLNRTDPYYEICLGYIVVQPNATDIQQTDIVDTRGDVDLCPWTTAVKGYEDYYDAIVQRFESDITLSSAGTMVVTDLSVSLYNDKYSLISVYCNGLREDEEDYSVDTSNEYITINFTENKSANAQISVILENFIDGEGLENVMDQYNQLVNDVAILKRVMEYTYVCNGADDNVQISNLVKDFLNETPSIPATLKINVVGGFGATYSASGDGSGSSPYKIFDFGNSDGTRKFILDFSLCSFLDLPAFSGSTMILFAGTSGQILNANVISNNTTADTNIKVFSDGGRWLVENCSFKIYGYNNTILAYCGTFVNCKASIFNVSGASWVFFPRANKLLRVIGGEYLSYTQDANSKSAVVGLNQNGNAVLIGVSAPTVSVSGYRQTNAIVHTAGKISTVGLVSALTLETISGASITGTIAVSVPNESW